MASPSLGSCDSIIYLPEEKHQTLKPALNLASHKIPEELAALPQFVGWRFGKRRSSGKRKKPPINPRSGRKAETDEPSTWGTLEEAVQCASDTGLQGIGFVLTDGDDFVGIDLDDCIDPATGEIQTWALTIIQTLDSYTEISPSGTGVRIIASGELPEKNERNGGRKYESVEIYDKGQYVTLTGNVYGTQKKVNRRQDALENLYSWISLKGGSRKATPSPKEPTPASPNPLEDDELLEKARRATNGPAFQRLYDEGVISNQFSHSEADLALMSMLAFWSGCDAPRMERLFTASALGQRVKWRRADYRTRTIERAIAGCDEVYEGKTRVGARTTDAEVCKILEEMYAAALADPWKGKSGPAERWVLQALMDIAGVYGKLCDLGVTVAAASRDLALKCGRNRQSVEGKLKRLAERGLIQVLEKPRGGDPRATLFLLRHNSCHNHHTGGVKRNSTLPTPPTLTNLPTLTNQVGFYGMSYAATLPGLLAKVGNPPPQTDKEFDKNGQCTPGTGPRRTLRRCEAGAEKVEISSELCDRGRVHL